MLIWGLLFWSEARQGIAGFSFTLSYGSISSKGYAYESCKHLLDTWMYKCERVLSFTKDGNERAILLLEKLGFERTQNRRNECVVFEYPKIIKEDHECMTKIMDGLYLADEDSATDNDTLIQNQIKRILTVRKEEKKRSLLSSRIS